MDYSFVPSLIKEYKDKYKTDWDDDVITFNVDTHFANQYEKELLEIGVAPESFHTQEGQVSAYIDAVDGKVGKSSYHPLVDIKKEFYGRNIEKAVKEVMKEAQNETLG